MSKKASLYEQFATDDSLEKDGVYIEYGNTRIKIAYAGGANKLYTSTVERLMQPYRRALQSGMLDNDTAEKVLKQAYAQSVIRSWETWDEKEEVWVPGIETPGKVDGRSGEYKPGPIIPANPENIVKVLDALDWVWKDLQQQANSLMLFRQHQLESDAKN